MERRTIWRLSPLRFELDFREDRLPRALLQCRSYRPALLLGLVLVCGACTDDATELIRPDGGVADTETVVHRIAVRHSPLLSVRAVLATEQLTRATAILADADDRLDVQCCLRLEVLDGEIKPTPRAALRVPVRIRGRDDFDGLHILSREAPGSVGGVLLVDGYDWCRRAAEANQVIHGCTVRGQIPATVYKFAPASSWAHEFGHSQNIRHLDDCPVEDGLTRVMSNNCPVQAEPVRLVSDECVMFRTFYRPLSDASAVTSGVVMDRSGRCELRGR